MEELEMVGDLFGSRTDRIEEVAGALGTSVGNRFVVAAVVAAEAAAAAVHHQRHRARRALDAVTAVAAEKHRRPSAPLHEEDRLLASIESFAEKVAHAAGKKGASLLPRIGCFAA
jgi:hypothetical protein